MRFFLQVRSEFALCWVFFIWFTSVVSSRDVIHPSNNSSSRQLIRAVALQTSPQVVAQCGKNVTLICDATSSSSFSVAKFIWLTPKLNQCQLQNGKVESDVLCESKAETLKHSLMLTLTNITPADQGKYTCKLHSDIGAEHNISVVTVQECRGSSVGYMNNSQAECGFYGVYPKGMVRWFQDGADLTGSATTHTQEDQNGLFNIKSTIQIWPGNKTQLYNCSLWIPSMRKYLSSRVVTVETSSSIKSSGSMIKLQWIVIVVGTLMIKFIM